MISELKTDQQRLESEVELRNKEVEDLRNQINSLTTTSDSLRAALDVEKTAKDHLQTALTLEQEAKEQAFKLVELEKEGREEAQSSISSLQSDLAATKEQLSTLFQQHEKSKDRTSELEKENHELKNSLPALESRVVENFCLMEGPSLKLCDSFTAGFLRAQQLALEQLEPGHPLEDKILNLEFPKTMGVSPEMEAKILERRGDAFAVLQFIKEQDPDILARWEPGQTSGATGDDGAEGAL